MFRDMLDCKALVNERTQRYSRLLQEASGSLTLGQLSKRCLFLLQGLALQI